MGPARSLNLPRLLAPRGRPRRSAPSNRRRFAAADATAVAAASAARPTARPTESAAALAGAPTANPRPASHSAVN